MVPKKNGKWRTILHLSAPEGHSVNDHINKDEFSIHYSSIDDAVALLSQHGQDVLMAKVDLKAAFQLIPVRAADWVHLGICWWDQFYVDTCLPFGLRSAPPSSTTTPRHSTGSWPTGMEPSCCTTWTIFCWLVLLAETPVKRQCPEC